MQEKFITLNLWQGGNLFNAIIPFLQKENPSIIAMQEVYDGKDSSLERRFESIEELKKHLNLSYYFFSPAFTDSSGDKRVVQGNAIFSRYPIISSETIFYDVPYGDRVEDSAKYSEYTPRNLQHAVVEFPNKKVANVFNTQGIWGVDGEDNERRIEMGETIARAVKGKERVYLTGDFNVRPGTKTIDLVEEQLKNIFKGELKSTFNMRIKKGGGFEESVVDMVFVSSDIEVVSKQCLDIDVSDHLPLVVEVNLL